METEQTKNRGGRPRKTENVKRDQIYTFRLTEEEEKLLQQRVEEYGASQSEFIRNSVLYKKIPAKKNVEEIRILQNFEHNLQAIGRNLNDIARAANTQKDQISKEELEKAKKECSDLMKQLTDIQNEILANTK